MPRWLRITLVLVGVFVAWGIGMSFVTPLSRSEDTKSLASALILVLVAGAILAGVLGVRAVARRR